MIQSLVIPITNVNICLEGLLCLSAGNSLAIIISFSALIVAVITLLVNIKSLKSQKYTEKNTLPVINESVQKSLLFAFLMKLLTSLMQMVALKSFLEDEKYEYYPSEHFLLTSKLPQDTFHSELYHNALPTYRFIQIYESQVEEYNSRIDVFLSHLKGSSINSNILSREINQIIKLNNYLTAKLDEMMDKYIETSQKEKQFKEWMDKMVYYYRINKDENHPDYYNDILIFQNTYHNFCKDEKDRKDLLDFMNARTDMYKKNYSSASIKRV